MRTVFIVLLFTALAVPASGGLDQDSSLFTEPTLGLRLTIPEGWSASTQTGYPGLLLLLETADRRSRIIVSTAELPPGKSLERVVGDSLSPLRALELTVLRSHLTTLQGRTVWEVAARTKQDVELRQLYLLRGQRLLTLSLAAPRGEVARLVSDLQQILLGTTLN